MRPRDPTADDDLAEIAAEQIEMREERAELAGSVETRDRLPERIEHALPLVMLGATLRIGEDWPDLHDIEGRLCDGEKRARRPPLIVVLLVTNDLVPAIDRR